VFSTVTSEGRDPDGSRGLPELPNAKHNNTVKFT